MEREVVGAGPALAQAGSGKGKIWLPFELIPLVGREAERASLEQALGAAGGMCGLRCEAGVVKTCLAQEALQRLHHGLILRAKATERETPLT